MLENSKMSEQTGQELLDVCELFVHFGLFFCSNFGLNLYTHEGAQEMYHQVFLWFLNDDYFNAIL